MVGTRVYIGGLPYGAREKDLERFFKGYGRIRDVLIKNGYGFVEFEDYRDADDAVYELNGKELLGERVSVEKARGAPRGSDLWRGRSGGSMSSNPSYGGSSRSSRRPSYGMDRPGVERYGPPTRTEFRLIVENLSSRVSWQDLKDYMRQAGEVTYADAHKQRRNEGVSCSVVEFATYQDMRNAIDKLDDTDLNGRRIRLVEDTRRRRRSRSSSSRSRSRSRSRGRRTRSRSRGRSSRSKSRSKSRGRSPHSRSRSKSRSRSRSAGGKKSSTRRRSKSRDKSPKRDSRSRSKSRSRSADKNDKQAEHKDNNEGTNHDGDADGNHRSASPDAKRRSSSPAGARSDDDASDDGRKGGESMEDD